MQVEFQFINFPKTKHIRALVEHKIKECVEKFSNKTTFVRAFFTLDGFEHHVKVSVVSGKINTCVNASSNNIALSIDKVVNKLNSSLRRLTKKRIHKRAEFSSVSDKSAYNVTNLRRYKRYVPLNENIFDKYETNYISDFEDLSRKTG